MPSIKQIWRPIAGAFRIGLLSMGVVFLIMCILAFTRVPFDMHRHLGQSGSSFAFHPDLIIMLGGSGMPSESNLIRLFYTAGLSEIYESPKIVIAHPSDAVVAGYMRTNLVQQGVDSLKINIMLRGTNTREQAIELINYMPDIRQRRVVVVTSPENMYRTVRVFRKLGFENLGGVAAFENAMFVDLDYVHHKLGGKKYVPDVSGNLDLRYNFWNYLKLEITCLREYLAITYYWLNGWL